MPRAADSPKKSRTAASSKDADKVEAAESSPPKRSRGRPKADGSEPVAKVDPKTKIVDGRLMKRTGLGKKVVTGKRGRPRKEYVWVDSGAADQE